MLSTSPLIDTEASERYIRRLCKHWGHKFEVRFNEHKGAINFGDANCTLEAVEGGLLVKLNAPKEKKCELQDAIIDHLARFCPKGETLSATWS